MRVPAEHTGQLTCALYLGASAFRSNASTLNAGERHGAAGTAPPAQEGGLGPRGSDVPDERVDSIESYNFVALFCKFVTEANSTPRSPKTPTELSDRADVDTLTHGVNASLVPALGGDNSEIVHDVVLYDKHIASRADCRC